MFVRWPGCNISGYSNNRRKKVKDIPAANSPSHRDAVHRLSGNSFDFYISKLRYSRSSLFNNSEEFIKRTTHLPNELALKMDGAEASDLNSTISANAKH